MVPAIRADARRAEFIQTRPAGTSGEGDPVSQEGLQRSYNDCSLISFQIEMQKQDVKLLRQLMKIQTSISILNGSRDPCRRSASFSSKHRPEFIQNRTTGTSQEGDPSEEDKPSCMVTRGQLFHFTTIFDHFINV